MRRRMPPEYVLTCRGPASDRLNASSSPSTRRRAAVPVNPYSRASMSRFSVPVRSSSTDAY